MTRKILFVAPVPPWPADSGGAQRSFLLYQALKRLGDVDLVLITANALAGDTLRVLRDDFGLKAVLRPDPGLLTLRRLHFGYGRIGVNVLRLTRWLLGSRDTLYRSGSLARELRALVRAGGYDLAVGRYLWTVVQSGVIDELPTWLDFDDLESEVWQSRSDEAGSRLLKAYYRQIADSYATRQRQPAAGSPSRATPAGSTGPSSACCPTFPSRTTRARPRRCRTRVTASVAVAAAAAGR